MAIISGAALKSWVLSSHRRQNLPKEKRLIISPILDPKQFGHSSVDVRLGNQLIITKKETGILGLDPIKISEIRENIERYQSLITIPYGKAFYLHPQEFALARTLEYVSLPENVGAYVLGRSSWGRLGLIIATATVVEPKFQGTITLELANVGSVPIALYPCIRVAQLVIHLVTGEKDHKGKRKFGR